MEKKENLEELELLKEAVQQGTFYDHPWWDASEPMPKWFDWFDWSFPFRTGVSKYNDANEIIAYKTYRSGSFKLKAVDTIYKKIWFLKALLEGKHCGSTRMDEGKIHFANSIEKFQFTCEIISEVMFFLHKSHFIFSPLINKSSLYTCPAFHTVEVKPETLKLIKNYELPT